MSREDNNYISVGSWMWMMFVTALPVIGFIMVIVWAFTGDNESRKNYFRAILMWFVVFFVVFLGLVLLGQLPALQQRLHG
jgi:Na+/melibiose symporter-like transporter